MRIAVVSDIHGNLTAFEAVLKHLRESSSDLVLHGGDLAKGGTRPIEVIDCIRSLGWQGVVGNTDEVLWAHERLEEVATRAPKLLDDLHWRDRRYNLRMARRRSHRLASDRSTSQA